MGSFQTPNITEVKVEVDEIRRMVDEFYARSVISKLEVTTIVPKVHVPNIWAISNQIADTQEGKSKIK